MFVDEKIEVFINPSNVKHYESLGYIIPREIRKNGQMQIPRKSKIIFDEFKQRLKSGEFNEFLNNNNLELVI